MLDTLSSLRSLPRSSTADLNTSRAIVRAPALAAVAVIMALLALLPLGSILAQQAPATPVLSSGAAANSRTEVTTISAPIPVIDGEVTNLLLKGKQLEVHYQNTGTITTTIIGELQVRDANGELVLAVPFAEAHRIDAGRKEKFTIAMPKLSPGEFTLYAVVDFGGDTMTAAQAALKIQP